MFQRFVRLAGATGLVCLALAAHLPAQGPGEPMPNFPFSSFRFNFIYPGGRATGMGQAFIAMGDDATGSETNPAGLTALVSPQLFVEGRSVRNVFHTLAPADGRIEYAEYSDTVFSPSFISLVYPLKNWAFGAYRQELANYSVAPRQATVTVPGVDFIYPNPENPIPVRVLEFQSRIDIEVVNYGFTVARRWGERFNVGFSARASRFASDNTESQPAELLAPLVQVPPGETEAILMRIQDEVWAFSWVAGAIVKPTDWLKVAGVYRSGSTHDVPATFRENMWNYLDQPLKVVIPDFALAVPDRYGAGVAVMPSEQWVFTLDFLRIEYGDLTAQFVDILQPEYADDYEFANGNEVHAGAEYTLFAKGVPVSLRGGFYTDADNTLHFLGDRLGNDVFNLAPGMSLPVDEVIRNFDVLQGALFPKSGRDYHGTFGVGLSVRGHLKLDFAGDLSRDTDFFVLSVLYNF
jgi:hypothetical protein